MNQDHSPNDEDRNLERPPRRTIRSAIATNLQTDDYVELAACLGYSIKKYNPQLDELGAELVLLVPNNNNITPASFTKLETVGWTIRYADDIAINGTDELYVGFQRNFIKFRVWTWTEYRKVVLLDADTLCLGDISLLLHEGFGTLVIIAIVDGF